VGTGPENEEISTMKCGVWGSEFRRVTTDLPFKVNESGIVILKNLPVLQCGNCSEYLIEDQVFARVEEILQNVDSAAELEIIRYAA
jgi:YgiT-type zinc finger domain-containing protein